MDYAQIENPLHTFPRSFTVDGGVVSCRREVANFLPTCYGIVSYTANYLDMTGGFVKH